MSYNGTGVYTLPGAQLINGEVVSATENNSFRNDVATALNTAWTRDGQAPATDNIPMASNKFTGLAAGTENGDSVRYEQVTSDVNITGGTISGVVIDNLEYTGTMTGGSGVINIGSGELYKSSSGDVGIGTDAPTSKLTVVGVIESTTTGVKFPDGSLQATAFAEKTWLPYTSSSTYTVPDGITSIRAYAIGAGGNGSLSGGGGGGGGMAYGDIAVTPGQTVTLTIASGDATVSYGGTAMLSALNGANGSGTTGGAGGTASKNVAVTNGGAYSGGAGGTGIGAGGGSSGSPLGNGYAGGSGGGFGGGGIGGAATYHGGGGAGGYGYFGGGGSWGTPSTYYGAGGPGRPVQFAYSDPLIVDCTGTGGSYEENSKACGGSGGYGGGGGGAYSNGDYATGGVGGPFGGGGGAYGNGAKGGDGGICGGGGGAVDTGSGSTDRAGNGGYGGGGGGGGSVTAASGGAALILLYV